MGFKCLALIGLLGSKRGIVLLKHVKKIFNTERFEINFK
jgi:hypothetical protein